MSVVYRRARRLVRLRPDAGHGPQPGVLGLSHEDRRQHARVRPVRRRQVLVAGQPSVSGAAAPGPSRGTQVHSEPGPVGWWCYGAVLLDSVKTPGREFQV